MKIRYRKWSKIHRDHKMITEDGTRKVIALDDRGRTVLVDWVGPEGGRDV